jgi:hypothetical protein
MKTLKPSRPSDLILEKVEAGPTSAGWHSIESGMRCHKEFQFAQIRKIRRPLAGVPDHLAIGLCFHAGRARWFSKHFDTSAKTWQSIEQAVAEEAEKQKLPVSLRAVDNTMRYLTEYVEHWSKRVKPKPVVAEYLIGPAALVKGDPFMLWRTARVDDASVYPEAMGLAIGEAKSTSTSINDCVNQYTLHGQIMLQYVLWKMSPQGEAKHGPLKGIMLDVVKKGYGKEKSQFGRQLIPVSDHAIKWFIQNLRRTIRDLAQIDWNTDAERNVTMCTRMIGKARIACEYRDLCRFGRSAAVSYVQENGDSLLTWKPVDERKVAPWE